MKQALLIIPCATGYVVVTVSPATAQLMPSVAVDWQDVRGFSDLDHYSRSGTVIEAVREHFTTKEADGA